MAPRPTPPTPVPADDLTEFSRVPDPAGKFGGPQAFARLTAGSKIKGVGSSQVKKPEPR